MSLGLDSRRRTSQFGRAPISACLLALLSIATIAGCSRSSKIEVTGQVTLDGQPLADGIIAFVPADGQGPGAGNLITAGQYAVEMLPGKKLVRIEGFQTVGTIKISVGSKPIDAPDKRPVVPTQYNAESKIEVNVDASHCEHNFVLAGKLKVK